MTNQSQSSHFRVLFESALQNYQRQTGMTLANHPLAKMLQSCDSVKSVTTVLQQKAWAFTEFWGDDDRIMKSLKTVVSVVYTLCSSTALSEAIGLVRQNASTNVLHLMIYSAALPTCKGNIHWHCHPSLCMILVHFWHTHCYDMRAH